MEITPVEPIGKCVAVTLHGDFEMDQYPPSPRGVALRRLRVGLELGLREASRKLGISAVNLSRLEMGKATCDWKSARELLLRGEPPMPARLRKSEWRWLAQAAMSNWFRAGDMLMHRLERRGLVKVPDATARRGEITTAWVTDKAMEAFDAHPADWGLPEGPRNCNLRRSQPRRSRP